MTNQPIAKLGDFIEKKKKSPRDHDMVEVNYIKKLMQAVGSQEGVAKKIGLKGASVNAILNEGKTRRVNELAARYVFERDYQSEVGGKVRTAVITAAPHQIKVVKEMITTLGGQCFVLPEKTGDK